MSIFLIHKDVFEKQHHILISGGEISESIFVDEKSDGGIVILTNNTCFFLRCEKQRHTVDGKIPAPVWYGNYSITLFTGVYTSQVVQDFFHQQYVSLARENPRT